MSGKKIYLTESQKQIIIESLLLDELPKSIKKQLDSNKTSLGKHPSFDFDKGNAFDKKITIKRFQEVKDNLSDIEDIDMSEESLTMELSKLLSKCRKLELPIRENLEKICYNTIVDMFSIPEDIINYSCELVDRVDNELNGLRLTPEEDNDETEFDNIEDIELTGEDVYKRRLINALIMGASMELSNKLAKKYIGEIYELNPKLPEIYSKIIRINNYLMFIKNDVEIINNERQQELQGGIANVTLGNEITKSNIEVQAIIFPTLLSESIRGFMELFAAHGLPKDISKAKYVLGQSDALIYENWDQRMGPVLWNLLYNSIDNIDTIILPNFFTKLVELPANEFHGLMKEVFAKTKEGKYKIQEIVEQVIYETEYDDFESTLDKKRADVAVIADDEYIEADDELLMDNELLENKATDVLDKMGYQQISFSSCTKLNNNKAAQNGGCNQGDSGVVKIKKPKKEAELHRKNFIKENVENVTFDKIGLSLENIVKIVDTTIGQVNDRFSYPDENYIENDDEWNEPVYNSKEEFYEECYDIGEMFNDMPDMIPIWRSIYVKSLKEINYEYLGESWSFDRSSAIRFGNNHAQANVLLKAFTPHNNVDWEETIKRYATESMEQLYSGDAEDELVIIDFKQLQNVAIDKTTLKELKKSAKNIIKECFGSMGFVQPKNELNQALEYFIEKEGAAYHNAYDMAKDFLEWIGPGQYSDFEIKQLEKHCERFLRDNGFLTEGKHKEYGGLKWLKDHQIPLTDEEKEYFKKHDVLYFSGDKRFKQPQLIHKAKAKDSDEEVYFANTHRAWQCSTSKSEMIKKAKFIDSTS
jgi:hypothetical protein